MYAIIYWDIKDGCYAFTNADDTLWLADTLKQADEKAEIIDEIKEIKGRKIDGCRVISIEPVE